MCVHLQNITSAPPACQYDLDASKPCWFAGPCPYCTAWPNMPYSAISSTFATSQCIELHIRKRPDARGEHVLKVAANALVPAM
jgi:hypothetical protein